MTTRLLPPAEWSRLAGTLLEKAWPDLDPRTTQIVAVEQGGQIVGCVALFQAWHLEGLWIAPEHQKRASVGRRLLLAAREAFRRVGAREVLMMAYSDEARRVIQYMGHATPLDGEHYAVVVE